MSLPALRKSYIREIFAKVKSNKNVTGYLTCFFAISELEPSDFTLQHAFFENDLTKDRMAVRIKQSGQAPD